MKNEAAPKRLQSLLFAGLVASGLFFAGCNTGQISGPEMDPLLTQQAAFANTDGGGTTPTGDHNGGCSVGTCKPGTR